MLRIIPIYIALLTIPCVVVHLGVVIFNRGRPHLPVWTMETLTAIIFKSLAWGFGVGLIVFVTFIFWGISYGGQMGPIGAFLLAPFAFVIGTILAGFCQIRRARTLPTWGFIGYVVFLHLALVPPVLVYLLEFS